MRGHSASGQLRTDQVGTGTARTILPNGSHGNGLAAVAAGGRRRPIAGTKQHFAF
jgi:hypothetical protein